MEQREFDKIAGGIADNALAYLDAFPEIDRHTKKQIMEKAKGLVHAVLNRGGTSDDHMQKGGM